MLGTGHSQDPPWWSSVPIAHKLEKSNPNHFSFSCCCLSSPPPCLLLFFGILTQGIPNPLANYFYHASSQPPISQPKYQKCEVRTYGIRVWFQGSLTLDVRNFNFVFYLRVINSNMNKAFVMHLRGLLSDSFFTGRLLSQELSTVVSTHYIELYSWSHNPFQHS